MLKKDFVTYDFTERLNKIPQEEREACLGKMKLEKYKKNDRIITEGEICHKVFLIVSGGIRSYTYKNDREITNWFSFENEAFTAYYSYLTGFPSQETIQALEDTTVYSLQKVTLQDLFNKYHSLESIGRELVEFYYRWQEERYFRFSAIRQKSDMRN